MTRPLVLTPQIHGDDGISAVARLTVRALAAAGEAPDVWSLHDRDGDTSDLAPEIAVRRAGGSKTRFVAWAAARSLSGPMPSHVVTMHVHLLPAAMPLTNRGCRTIVYLHGIEVWQPLPRKLRWALERTDVVLANSSYTAGRFVADNPTFANTRIDICPPSLPPGWSPAQRTDTRGAVALIVGRMSAAERYKGHDRLIDAWPAILARVPAATLIVIGDGDDRARLQSLARDSGVAQSISFRGRVSSADLRAAYAEARVFVMPSGSEGFGIVYLEAMASGLPCIASPGAAEEIVEHERSGLIVPLDSRDALIDAVAGLLADPGRAADMGRYGAARVATVFPEQRFRAGMAMAMGLPASSRC